MLGGEVHLLYQRRVGARHVDQQVTQAGKPAAAIACKAYGEGFRFAGGLRGPDDVRTVARRRDTEDDIALAAKGLYLA